jgi:PEP-CTERM motif-containing protein
MNRYTMCAVVAALALFGCYRAQATPIDVTAGAPGVLTPDLASASVLTFDDLPIGILPFYAFADGTLSGSGAILDGTVPHAAQPAGDATKYLAVSYPDEVGAVQLLLSTPENYFGLYWGSMDDWNSIAFFSNHAPIAAFSGADIAALAGLAADGDQQSFTSSRYINFYLGATFYDEVILSTATYNFEVDNIAFGDPPLEIPEPSSLMLLGFALGGTVALRRRRTAASPACL